MTGGLMQLVACGAQDIFLTGSPMISYFKTVYRRHTNFAIETVKQSFDTPAGFGVTTSCTLSRNGDLITGAYIQASLPDLTEKDSSNFGISNNGVNNPGRRYTRWIDNIGHYLIKSVEISIGGNLIDRHYSDWLEIWAQLTIPAGKMEGYRKMIGQDPKNALGQNTGLQADVLSSMASFGASPYAIKRTYIVGRDIFIPLQFWFCRNLGLALPLIALQYNDVRIQVSFREAEELIQVYAADTAQASGIPVGWVPASDYHTYVTHDSLSANLWVDYVFLDADERRRFAQVSHEYLIEQVQYQEDSCMSNSNKHIRLNFNHPVKELLWVIKGFETTREWSNFTNTQLPDTPPFQTIQVSNNQLDTGLTGLPSETFISPTKLTVNITPTSNTTGFFKPIQTDIVTSLNGYVMLNGDTITINVNGDTDTNITLTVLNASAEDMIFYTNEVLIYNQIYNTVVSIVRTAGTLQPDKISINLRQGLTGGGHILPYRYIIANTINMLNFTVTTKPGFVMVLGDVIYMVSSTDNTTKLTLVVAAVDSKGTATEFFMRDYNMVAGVNYDTVVAINRTGRYVPMIPLIMNIHSAKTFNKGDYIDSNAVAVPPYLTGTFLFIPSGSYVMKVNDIITVASAGDEVTTNTPPVVFRVSIVENGIATQVQVHTSVSTQALYGYVKIISIQQSTTTINSPLSINVRPNNPVTKGQLLNNANTVTFSMNPSPPYTMKIGDIIKLLPLYIEYSDATAPAVISLKVTKINNNIATEFLALSNIMPLFYTTVLSIEPYDINFQTQQLVLNQSGLSDIKTYDDLMRFSNYDSVRPYSSVNGMAGNTIKSGILTMNTAERFAERPGTYFSLVQPYLHHTNIPVSPGINVYSFSLKPEEHQPSGTCNFSRIEDGRLSIKTGPVYQGNAVKPNTSLVVKIFAFNYNILRIFNGMGGLAYNG